MKQYLITEEELSSLIAKSVKLFNIQELWDNIQKFLKSKQPVEFITEFRPTFVMKNYTISLDKYMEKHIKIYIEKE